MQLKQKTISAEQSATYALLLHMHVIITTYNDTITYTSTRSDDLVHFL